MFSFPSLREIVCNLTISFSYILLSHYSASAASSGNVNGDMVIDARDTILALKVLTSAASEPLTTDSDVNGDAKVGLAEAIYSLQHAGEDVFQPVALQSSITGVQPMTGLVFWSDSDYRTSDAIQLEYTYVGYDKVVTGPNTYDWSYLDNLLTAIASRGHQAIVRMYFVYPGYATTVPAYIKALSGYTESTGTSEGLQTWFPDWSNSTFQNFVLDFYTAFSKRYDNDARLAFLQVGFGLWAEYHIYDGPMTLGETFPSKAFQTSFFNHLSSVFQTLAYSVSIDAAETERSPFAVEPSLLALNFGLFDDSFLSEEHDDYNAACFNFFSFNTRYGTSPMGGELSYYTDHDQQAALEPTGPHGVSFEQMAAQYHISYMIGNDQPEYQTLARIREAGMSTGYRFAVTSFESSATESRGTIANNGIAPIYYDAYVTVNGIRSTVSLRGLMPGQSLEFSAASGGDAPTVTIESDRLVTGQTIEFTANLTNE